MNLIVAVDRNWAIGRKNELLFHIPEDMKFFRSKTLDRTVICGKNTLLSFPGSKPLPRRRHIVLTRQDFPDTDQMTVAHSLQEMFDRIADLPEEDVFVIGGETVYRQLYRSCKTLFVTHIQETAPDADSFFPNLKSEPDFVLREESPLMVSSSGLSYSFATYENTNVRLDLMDSFVK